MYGFPPSHAFAALIDQKLTQLRVGVYQIQLVFDGDLTLSIQSTFTHSVAPPSDPAEDFSFPRSGSTLTSLLGSKVTSAITSPPESLTIAFSNGESLTVYDDDPHYEALSFSGPGFTVIV